MKATNEQVSTKPSSIVITVPDPDTFPVTTYGDLGGTIEFRSDAPNYPHFEIQFAGNNPEDSLIDRTFVGTNDSPLMITINKEGAFTYWVTYLTDEAHQYRMNHPDPTSDTVREFSASTADPAPPTPPPPPPAPRLGPFFVPCKHCP